MKVEHKYKTNTPSSLPKQAQIITSYYTLPDGIWLKEKDHFDLRKVLIPTQENLNNALKNYIKYCVCLDCLKALHKMFKENSYYQNLGIIENPSLDLKSFKDYIKINIETNCPSKIEEIINVLNSEYHKKCNNNNITGEYGDIFDN